MTELRRARITPLDARDTPLTAKAFDVQFNPASLRLQTSAQPAGGGQQSSVRRQAATNAKTTLSMDLHFDTYDEGSTDDPVPVTRKTAQLEQFLKPVKATQGGNPVPPPPRIKFVWAGFEITGIVNQLSVEYDHFHHLGAPLRAKCSLTLESQDPLLAAPPAMAGPAAPADGLATRPPPAGPAALPAAPAAGLPTRGALAQAGESLAAFAQRNGLDPRDWRALAQGIADVAALPAGREITFAAPGATGSARGAADGAAAAVTAAGGPLAAATAAKAAAEAARTERTRTAFGVPPALPTAPATTAPAVTAPAAPRPTPASGQAPPVAAPPAPVPRPFGAGIPLRPRLGTAQPSVPSADWNSGGGRTSGRCGCGSP
jgi:hypothetical protein